MRDRIKTPVWVEHLPLDSPLDAAAAELTERLRRLLASGLTRFSHASAPDRATLIVFIETPQHKWPAHGARLKAHPLVREFPERCFAYDWADGPAGFLPGVYPSLPRQRWDPGRLVSGGFLLPYNPEVSHAAQERRGEHVEPNLLLSFAGAASHPVRRQLVEGHAFRRSDVSLGLGQRWFDHSVDEQRAYVGGLCAARFALCPRGVGPATFRVYEAMALSRCPVIVSDDWLAPEGPNWGAFALVIGEAQVGEVMDIVEARAGEWRELGRAARRAWEEHFAGDQAIIGMLAACHGISLRRRPGSLGVPDRRSRRALQLRRDNGWTAPQRAVRLLTSAAPRRRVLARLVGRGHRP